MDDDGKVVSHLARIPVPMLVDASPVNGALTVDAATLEAYRARGIYTQVRIYSNDASCREGLTVALDFRAPGRKLPRGSAQRVAAYQRHMIPLDERWLADRIRIPVAIAKPLVRAAGVGRGPVAEEVDGTPDDLDVLWARVARDVRHGVRKEGTWWRWRYDARPQSPYRYFVVREGGEPVAVAVATNRGDPGQAVLAVLELLAKAPESARSVVRAMAGDPRGAGALAFLAPPETFWSRVAREAGFRALPAWADRKRPSLHNRDLCGDRPELTRLRWESTWGDMDHV
jgi:hypothetical protein